jgi:hypothetical protein
VIVVALALVLAADGGLTTAEKALASDTPETIASRAKALKAATADGLIGKIDFDNATVPVGGPFYALDFEDKRTLAFLVVMEGMAHRKRADFNLTLVDRKNGKTVGHFLTSVWSFTYDGP